MNEQLRMRLQGIQDGLLAQYTGSVLLPNAVKGDEREVLIREFLAKVFPSPYRFGSGAVTDADGRVSGQNDVIIEWPFFASFPSVAGEQRLYLAESVAFVIEVKSDVSAQWNQVETTVEKIRPLRRYWRTHIALNDTRTDVDFLGPTSSRIPISVVGFTGFKTVDALRSKIESTPEEKRPDAVLVIDSGAYLGWGIEAAQGLAGLFAFCVDGSFFARNVLFAEPELVRYLTDGRDSFLTIRPRV